MLRDDGDRHHAAVRALAFKWQRIIFRCWRNNTPYDEKRYLNQLRSKGSRFLNYLDPPHEST